MSQAQASRAPAAPPELAVIRTIRAPRPTWGR